VAKFWVESLAGHSVRRLRLSTTKVETDTPSRPNAPVVTSDATGWPVSIRWPGMTKPLFLEGFGGFSAVKVKAFAPRWALADIRAQRGEARERLRREILEEVPAVADTNATVAESLHAILITQPFRHPRLQWGTRVLEIWKGEPRARLTLRFNRISSVAPEIFYVAFPLPTGSALPRLSNGGVPFTPFADQLPGTCADYFAIDSWADYVTPEGRWLWVSPDAPLMALGPSPTLSKRQSAPSEAGHLLAMVFNNFWYTNFAADEHGIMEFRFDLVWQEKATGAAADLAEALMVEPVLVINPNLPEDGRVLRNLFQP
jgi:hypothetical protein